MSQYRLPKVLGYIKSNKLRKGFPIINELRQLREVEAHYESEQGWMQAKVADCVPEFIEIVITDAYGQLR